MVVVVDCIDAIWMTQDEVCVVGEIVSGADEGDALVVLDDEDIGVGGLGWKRERESSVEDVVVGAERDT